MEKGRLTMPDREKEKLVELLEEPIDIMPGRFGSPIFKIKLPYAEVIADRMIAHGVTVQGDKDINVPSKWISVKDRLPEVCDSYLVVVKYKYDHEKEYNYDTDVATYYPYDNPSAYIDERWDTYNDWDEGQQYLHITHWMPLPQPPKGE
jgi:hypothetical protein